MFVHPTRDGHGKSAVRHRAFPVPGSAQLALGPDTELSFEKGYCRSRALPGGQRGVEARRWASKSPWAGVQGKGCRNPPEPQPDLEIVLSRAKEQRLTRSQPDRGRQGPQRRSQARPERLR